MSPLWLLPVGLVGMVLGWLLRRHFDQFDRALERVLEPRRNRVVEHDLDWDDPRAKPTVIPNPPASTLSSDYIGGHGWSVRA